MSSMGLAAENGVTVAPKKNGHDRQCHDREQHQHGDLPFRWGIGEQAESRAAILDVGKAKESGDNLNGLVQRNIPGHNPLRSPVEDQYRQCNREVKAARGVCSHSGLLEYAKSLDSAEVARARR